MPKRKTFDEVLAAFNENGYELLERSYKNNKQLLRYKCRVHNAEEQFIRLNDLVMGHGCRFCGRERSIENLKAQAVLQRLTYTEVKEEFEKRGYELLDKTYARAKNQLSYICPNHPDKIQKIRINDLKRGGGCRYCAIDAKKLPFDEVRSFFKSKGYILIESKGEYVNSSTPMRYICPSHEEKDTRITTSSLRDGHGCWFCAIDRSQGKLSAHYNHDLPDEIRAKDRRYDDKIHAWRKDVYQRDNYTCIVCSDDSGGNLNAHHKDGFNWCVKRRYDVDNGATLCEDCHREFHSEYGYGDNTEQQFNEWISQKEASE